MEEIMGASAPNTASVPQQNNFSQEVQKNDAPQSPVSAENNTANTNTNPNAENGTQSQYGSENGNGKILASGTSGNDGSGYVLVEDETGKRVLKPVSQVQAPAETENATETVPDSEIVPAQSEGITEQAAEVAEQLEAKPQVYNLDEFSTAIASGNVDESRVPQEYQKQYADYKIQKAIAEYNANVEAQKQQQAQVEAQLSPEEKQKQMQDFLANLDQEAEKRAAQSVGFTEDDLDNIEFMEADDPRLAQYKMFKEWHRQELMQSVQQRVAEENVAKAKQQAIYSDINNFVAKAKAEEPNFEAIDKMLPERYKTLPYAEGQKVETVLHALKNGSITEEQTVILREYYENTRKEYYAKKNGLSTTPKPAPKPPVVESAGNGKGTSQRYVPDYSALANADVRSKRTWLAEFLRNRNQ